ncbi:MAG: hypothetical protein EOM91_23590 [Sphingobacteriia bacterium]|nr:hypothetical protein [Sphingobacteriia bacterium]
MNTETRNHPTIPQQIEDQQSWSPVAECEIPECRALGLRIHRQTLKTGGVIHWAAHALHVARYHANGGEWEYRS